MTLAPVSLALQTNQARFKQEGSARLVNWYAEQTGKDAKAPWTLYANSGLDLWTTVTNSGTVSGPTGVRCMLATDTYLYVVAGRDISAVNSTGAVTYISTLPADGAVYMARNRRSPTPEVAVVADGTGYIITGTSITTITDADLPPPTSVSVLDGYFLFPTTFDRVFISGEDNGSSIAPLDFGKAQKKPDNTLYALGGERDALIFGGESVEFWNDSPDGTGNFPFVPVAAVNIGTIGAKTIISLDRAVAMIANDGTARVQDGYSFKRISTHAIERIIASVDASTIQGFGWNEPDTGHAWLCWTCDTWTISYNLRTGLWSERASFGRTNWRGCQAVSWQGKTLIGDYEDGRIYEISSDVYTEGGDPIPASAVVPIINMAPYAFRLNAVFVDMITGVGQGTLDEDRDPQLLVSTSSDGGKTFDAARSIEIGPGGSINRRLKSYRFGMFGPQGCAIKLECSASVARAISGMTIDVDRLSH